MTKELNFVVISIITAGVYLIKKYMMKLSEMNMLGANMKYINSQPVGIKGIPGWECDDVD